MDNHPAIYVGKPDGIGSREVTIDGKPAGRAWSRRGLARLLRRRGLEYGPGIRWEGGEEGGWPGCPWLRLMTVAFMALGLLVTAAVLGKIGWEDTFASAALTWVGHLGGATFLVAAAIEVFAVIAALDYWTKRRARYSGPTVLFGALIALVVNASLLYLQVSGHVFAHWFWLWIVLTAWSLWALVILLRDRAWSGLNYPVRISILAIVSGVLAVANVAYSQVYVPYSALPLVESAAEFKGSTLNGKGTKMYLPVHFSVKNAGGVSVYILGSIYWIRGGPAKDPDCLQRATSSADCEVIKSDYLIPPPGQELVPGEELSEDAVVKIDHPEKFTYEVVTAQTEVYLARTDRMTIDRGFENYKNSQQLKKEGKDKDPEGPPNVDYLRYQANISNGNEILNATRGHPRVTLWWANSVPRPFIYVDVGPPGHRNGYNPDRANGNPEVVGRYGFKVLRSSTVRAPFVELLDTAQDDLNAK